MQKNTKEWNSEVEYLNNTKKAIDDKIIAIQSAIEYRKPIVDEMKEYFMKRSGDLDEYEKREVYQRIDDFMIAANEQLDMAKDLSNIKEKPYFARIDFQDNNGVEKVYLGLRGVDDLHNYYVIDWRAPIGELFYDYGIGPASFDTPEGKVSGNVVLKRQYDINKGQLLDAFDVDINIFDEYLQRVLSNVNSDKLHNVVSTIQKEQNAIIRNTKSDLLIVQGCVGSGKTTVALHRIAYLLYKLPNIKSNNILFFSPNEIFVNHISGVLPELGENNTLTATFPRFVRKLLNLQVRVESTDEFCLRMESMEPWKKDLILTKFKLSMRDKIQKFLKNYDKKIHFSNGFSIAKTVYSREYLNELWHNTFANESMPNKYKLIVNKICTECKIKKPKFIEVLDEELKRRLSHSLNLYDIFNDFLLANNFEKCIYDDYIGYDDAILLIIMRFYYNDIVLDMDIKQVVIDEAQEYPVIFVDFLMRLFPHAQFCIVGDDNQVTTPGAMNSLKDLLELNVLFGDSTYAILDKTYRSSEEIMEYANTALGLMHHNAFRMKNGQKVKELSLANDTKQIAQQVFDILEQVVPDGNSIGIVVGDSDFAQKIYNELSKLIPHRVGIVRDSHSSVNNQIQILAVTLSKGLEFDTAIVLENGGLFESVKSKSYKYIAYTRAINKLYVIKK